MRRIVLVTRPQPGLTETMRAVAARGFVPLASPLLTVRPLAPAIPRLVQAVLLTSGQAADRLGVLAPWLHAVPVLAVGDATARRARAAGFASVSSADGDAALLAALASARLATDAGPLLLGCGDRQALALAASLRQAGFRVLRRCVYRASPVRRLDPAVLAALRSDQVAAMLFFSGATAAGFVRLAPRDPALAAIRALAISPAVAGKLAALSWKSVEAARRPTEAGLLDLLGSPPG